MSINYKKIYLYSESIIIRKFSGIISVDDVINSWDYLIKNHLLTEKQKGAISDLTQCQLDINPESFEKIALYLKNIPLFKHLKIAVISNTPDKTVFPLMGEMQEKELKIKVFYTIEAAINWIIY